MTKALTFVLGGASIKAIYRTCNSSGDPELNFGTDQMSGNYRGQDIELTKTPIGTLATVTVHRAADGNFTTFSLLMPDIPPRGNLGDVRTIGIDMIHKVTGQAAQANPGPWVTYQVHELTGHADSEEV